MPPTVVGWATVRPDALGAALDAFQARLGPDAADALGPAGAAWARAQAQLTDRLTDLAPAIDDPDPWVGWGLDRRRPIRLAVSAPDGLSLARALAETLRAADDPERLATIHAAVTTQTIWRARIVAEVGELDRLLAGLGALANRLGLEVLPRDPAGQMRWRARDASTGLRLWLRTRGPHAALDLAAPAIPGGRPDPPALDGNPWPDAPPAPLLVGLNPAALGALDAALTASRAFTATADLEPPAAQPIWTASAEIIGHCAGVWRAAASRARALRVGLAAPEGRPRLVGEARLTDIGARAWATARRPMPLASLADLPAALQIALAPDGFLGRGRLDGPGWLAEARLCPAGHPLAISASALGVLPALATAELIPGPSPPGEARSPQGLATALVGATPVDGEAVPIIATAVVASSGAGPAATPPPAPLGPEVEPVPGTETWVRGGAVPAAFGVHRRADRQIWIFGLGDGAHAALAARLPPADQTGARPAPDQPAPAQPAPDQPATVLDAHLDPHALARALAEAGERGPGVAALRAVGDRFGRWRLRAVHHDQTVRVALESAPSTPSAELDRRHPSQ